MPPPPQSMNEPGSLELLTRVEHLLSTYTAVRGVWDCEHFVTPMDEIDRKHCEGKYSHLGHTSVSAVVRQPYQVRQ